MLNRHPVDPGDEVIAIIIDSVVLPKLNSVASEVTATLRAESSIWNELEEKYRDRQTIIAERPDCAVIDGECRLRFRTTTKENRFLFFAQTLFPRTVQNEALGGFCLNGDISKKTGKWIADLNGWTVNWNDWTWEKWY